MSQLLFNVLLKLNFKYNNIFFRIEIANLIVQNFAN